jgi:hypothetical protein
MPIPPEWMKVTATERVLRRRRGHAAMIAAVRTRVIRMLAVSV